jgi:hypothetical protein
MGRRYALARPALCTLYYSLRLISTNPVGPSLKRPWPVHYIIGWMGAYIKHIIGDKVKKPHILFYNHCSRRPMMANTMFRTPSASILKKHLIFCAKMLIFFGVLTSQVTRSNWAQSPLWVSRIFCLSVRRGLLSFRRTDLCIAEPYHPDCVARQFKIDQVLPYSPLVDVHTEEDFGIAYAY